ncbi:hypothetical protein ABVK25_002498 [Lepraria finkii]|uniref:Period circadian protein n=1 Tax=Lepraria finkii TaxID=1340010 RepID=A0ABR4BI84_9LECA
MRTSAFLAVPAFTALALAQTGSNPAQSYITQTNSLGVATGQPLPVTTQPKAVTTQPAVATGPATGPGSTLVIAHSGVSGSGSGSVVGGKNGTVSTGKLGATSTSTGGTTATSSSGSSTSTGTGTGSSDAGLLEPMLGLGFAGVLFAAFL